MDLSLRLLLAAAAVARRKTPPPRPADALSTQGSGRSLARTPVSHANLLPLVSGSRFWTLPTQTRPLPGRTNRGRERGEDEDRVKPGAEHIRASRPPCPGPTKVEPLSPQYSTSGRVEQGQLPRRRKRVDPGVAPSFRPPVFRAPIVERRARRPRRREPGGAGRGRPMEPGRPGRSLPSCRSPAPQRGGRRSAA